VPEALRLALAIAAKDIRAELRSRTALLSAVVFAALVLVVFNFARDPTVLAATDLAPSVLERSVVTSFQLDTVLKAVAHGRPMRHVWLVLPQVQVDLGLDRVIATAKAVGLPMLGLRQNMLNAKVVATVREAGLGIGGWACNDAEAIARLLELKVDVFTTDRPDLAIAQRKVLGRG